MILLFYECNNSAAAYVNAQLSVNHNKIIKEIPVSGKVLR
jgi:hypothetical protein